MTPGSSPACCRRRAATCSRSSSGCSPGAARPATGRSTTCSPTTRSARARAFARRSASRLPGGRRAHRAGAPLGQRPRALPQRVPRPRRHRGRLRVPARTGDDARGARRARGDQRRRRHQRAGPRAPARATSQTLGVRKSLLVLREVERMARESVEGQAIELGWIADERFDLEDRDYVRMAYKKTCWYTVIAPLRIGVICGARPGAGHPARRRAAAADRARLPRRDRVPDPRRPAQPRGRRGALRQGDRAATSGRASAR